jgi:hypothetical protein
MHKTHGAYAESVILTQFLLELEGKYGENALIELLACNNNFPWSEVGDSVEAAKAFHDKMSKATKMLEAKVAKRLDAGQ